VVVENGLSESGSIYTSMIGASTWLVVIVKDNAVEVFGGSDPVLGLATCTTAMAITSSLTQSSRDISFLRLQAHASQLSAAADSTLL